MITEAEFNVDLIVPVTILDGMASMILFQARSFKFYLDGLIIEAEFNQDVGLIAPFTVLDAPAPTTPFSISIWMACSSRSSSTRTHRRCVPTLQNEDHRLSEQQFVNYPKRAVAAMMVS